MRYQKRPKYNGYLIVDYITGDIYKKGIMGYKRPGGPGLVWIGDYVYVVLGHDLGEDDDNCAIE